MRKRLDQITHYLNHFQVGFNLTLVHSEMAILDTIEARQLEAFGFSNFERPLLGQSPYVVNADITYNNLRIGTRISLLFNVFGERYMVNAESATPDIYERPRHMLDVTMNQRLFSNVNLKLAAKNILNDPVTFSHEYKGREFIDSEYWTGVSFSVGLSYGLE
jgi:hypothetical protein